MLILFTWWSCMGVWGAQSPPCELGLCFVICTVLVDERAWESGVKESMLQQSLQSCVFWFPYFKHVQERGESGSIRLARRRNVLGCGMERRHGAMAERDYPSAIRLPSILSSLARGGKKSASTLPPPSLAAILATGGLCKDHGLAAYPTTWGDMMPMFLPPRSSILRPFT